MFSVFVFRSRRHLLLRVTGAFALVAASAALMPFADLCSAQEYYASNPANANVMKAVPDAVRYRFFLRHVAAFEHQARAEEAKGQSGQPLRNHFIQKFGITPTELRQITDIALAYENSANDLHAQAKQAGDAFKAQYAPTGVFQSGAIPPPELRTIRVKLNALALQSRDKVHAALGDVRFAAIDLNLRTRGATIRAVGPNGTVAAIR